MNLTLLRSLKGACLTLSCLALVFVFSETSFAKGKEKRTSSISFEQCCKKHKNATEKCLKMKSVKKKKKKSGKNWVNKTCPAAKKMKKALEQKKATEDGHNS